MAEDDDDTATAAPLQKRMLSRSHGSRAISGRTHDLPPVPSRMASGPPSGDHHW
jgi:hypothetical protein